MELHTFAVATAGELESWLQTIVTSTQQALFAMPQLTITCRWRGIDAQLVLHMLAGISLVRTGSPNKPNALLWSFPFEKVRSTADDGKLLLWINFGSSGEQVRLH